MNEKTKYITVDDKVFDVMFESYNLRRIYEKLIDRYGEKGNDIYEEYKKAFKIMFKTSTLSEFYSELKREYGEHGVEIYFKCKRKFIIKKKLGIFRQD